MNMQLQKGGSVLLFFVLTSILMSLGAGLYAYGAHIGAIKERSKLQAQNDKLTKELTALKLKAIENIKAKDKIIADNRRKADDQISKLIEENLKLKNWWKTRVPDDAGDYAYKL